MARYSYNAIDQSGKTVSGVIASPSAGAAHLMLLSRGLQPVSVEERTSVLQYEVTKKKVPREEVMHFSRQLGVFIKSGIPILDALEILEGETGNKLFKKALQDMVESLQAGDTFALAAEAHPEAFPPYYIGMLSSAELAGNLDVVLGQLSDYMERDAEARSKVTSAMIYPSIVLGMSIVTVVVLGVFVMPRFKNFFQSLHAKLPLPTLMLIRMTNFFEKDWYFIFGAIAAVVVIIAVAFRSKQGRARIDSLLLRLPIAGDLIEHVMVERICRILSSMIQAGVSLPEAMVVTSESVSNIVYKKGLDTIRDEMLEGRGLAEPVASTELFPSAARQMMRVGEETGTLDEQLQVAAQYYARELDFKIKRFTSLFEPAIIIVMGVVVGFVAVALISAMYGIYRQVKVT
ncbi:MAG TPA: type II secretion system F family protein [Acidimicrobiales bacterium]|nr:type II secretion system F family protein [Acidimicrobiales bacterium]